MKRTVLLYVVALVLFASGVTAVLHFGRGMKPPAGPAEIQEPRAAHPPATPSIWSALQENSHDPVSRLLIQFIVVVLATRGVGWLFSRVGQPSVIGEMTAGILLGPSLFGWLWPAGFSFVFAPDSLGTLRLFSQIGVCIFMFVVGLELDVSQLRDKAHAAVVVSHAGIMLPFLLGVSASLLMFPSLAAPGATFTGFALFMGIALSITAFPVLARILKERGIEKTFLGTTALTCAAVEDATAWSVLAFVVAIVRATGLASTFLSLALVAAFVLILLGGVRPLLNRWVHESSEDREPGRGVIAGVLVFMSACALATELIGIHALFGSFLAGVVMPRKRSFREELTLRLGGFGTIFLLPLFFAFSGLRTHVGLLNDAKSWFIALGIICIAVAGKLGGCMITARIVGLSWLDSFSLGALMNTRGLVELIALNIGYDLGILPPRIFTMMVLMALATTFMAGPLLNVAEWLRRRVVVNPPYGVAAAQ